MRALLRTNCYRITIISRNTIHTNSQSIRANQVPLNQSISSSLVSQNLPTRALPPHLDRPAKTNPLDLSENEHEQYFTENEVDSFYESLMKSSPEQLRKEMDSTPSPNDLEHLPILGPYKSASLKQQQQLWNCSSKAIESPSNSSDDPTQMARNLQSEKLIDLVELMKTRQVDIGPITDSLLTLLAHLPQPSKAQRSIQVLSEAYSRASLTKSSAFQQAHIHLLLYRSGSTPTAAYQAASKYVQELERVGTPPTPAVYLQLFEYLSYTSHRRAHSLDLFNRVRLLAHPTPPISIWNAVLKALASGASTEPERSMDIYLDLKAAGLYPTRETYNHLIRAMARARRPPPGTSTRRTEAEKWYSGSLRLLDRMIHEDGLKPDLNTYMALLEGSKRLGDLPRAKWIYGLFCRELDSRPPGSTSFEDSKWLSVKAVTLMLQTYASFTPMSKLTYHKSPNQKPVEEEINTHKPLVATNDDPMAPYRGVPKSKKDTIVESDRLIHQFLSETGGLNLSAKTPAEQRKLSILVGSYLSVYAAHSDIANLYKLYQDLTISPLSSIHENRDTKAIRITWIYLLVLERCEYVRSAERAGKISREVFHEWRSTGEWQDKFELVKSVEARLVLTKAFFRSMIKIRFGGVKESMKDIEDFTRLYPIENIQSSESTPYLSFKHLEIVHHRLKQNEDRESVKRLLRITKGYEKARIKAFEMNEENRRIKNRALMNL
ncbi:uncharacterized protein MELLADRAFT_112172 [Melampsora larici-populina 98AG31]|uniref:Uncharacterized protein n=1 Tax=Melampsora larici-populina (strain 98AG31 / pathotype 3-4-7) TaxID=747676 RepID=F4S5L9_MELLP|nr:uncharacterized protein MELLADRAFT_112172 [Melampsora larici-populina 98AG31]EGG00085.1 hypothetical protein MELLADRAFT_112172 [Melampsora larici-populina 98AG31]